MNGKTMAIALVAIAILGLVVWGAVQAFDVDAEGGRMPDVDVDVDADSGKLPDVEVKGPEVEIEKKEVGVTVPDVDVDVDSKRVGIPVPDIDVNTPEEQGNEPAE